MLLKLTKLKFRMRTLVLISFLLMGLTSFAQTTVKGKVVDQNNEPIPGASIVIQGKAIGTVSDFDGYFTLSTTENPPFTLSITSIGFVSVTSRITQNNQTVAVTLNGHFGL